MWTASIMPKIKFFMLRMAWNILPTANNLRMRRVQVERVSCVCGMEKESVGHVLFECDFSLKVWERV